MENTPLNWTAIGNYSIAVVQLLVLLYIALRGIPSWKDVRIKEIESKTQETNAQLEMAKGLGQISAALMQVSTVTHDIAIEQRKATENLKISQRVSSSETTQLSNAVEILTDRMDSLEDTLKDNGYETRPKAVKTTRN